MEMEPTDFLAVLGRRLTGVRAVEAELARRIASGFNVFDYLRKDEYGLSRVVADLLDPAGPHGQGTLFLASFIGLVNCSHPRTFLTHQWRLDECKVVVTREAGIDTKEPELQAPRRLDIRIVVEAPNHQPGCIAIENKPYAGDGDNQVNAYRKWLACTYKGQVSPESWRSPRISSDQRPGTASGCTGKSGGQRTTPARTCGLPTMGLIPCHGS